MIVLLNRASNNQPVALTKQIANSGEGEVWETNLSGYLAKLYHDPTPARIEKLKVMLANPPADPMLSRNHISIAWPSDLLQDSIGKYLGFLMPAIRDSKQLSSVYNPRRRKKIAPGFNWYYLHVTALNTAWIIQEIHAKGYVLGDIKLENILVNDRAMVAVIDTDSFQVRDSQSNKVYRCTVGSEDFTPAELLGKDFSTTNQTEIHDRFRLGVLIHYLLFGYHPFSGQWTGAGESPEQTELIRKGYWYSGKNSLIRPSQNTIHLDVVHPEVKKLFLKCFNDGHTRPLIRPTAQDWHNALEVAVNELTFCSKVNSHHYSKHYGKCYWCERVATLGVDIFPGSAGTAKVPSQTRQPSQPPQVPSQYRQQTVSSSHSTSSNQSSKQPSSRHSNNSSPTTISYSFPSLQVFAFDVVKTVQGSGLFGWGSKVTLNRSRNQAQYFIEDLGNGVTLEMVSIPGGSFIMGALLEEKGSNNRQRPQHKVKIKPFFMGKFQVTQAQWRAVASLPKVNRDLDLNPSHFKGNRLPVERVSWYDVVEFCARLSKLTRREYRLPSEAEWEYACRAGTTTPFYCGETITTDLANYNGNYTYASEPKGEKREKTTAVGSFPPNAFGLYDMHGNVWEWCDDTWHTDYRNAPKDGSSWIKKGDNNFYLIRGGSWDAIPSFCRSAVRFDLACGSRDVNVGFRVVCVAPRT